MNMFKSKIPQFI